MKRPLPSFYFGVGTPAQWQNRRGVDRLRRVFSCFADHAASRAGRRHHRCPRSSGLIERGDQREPCRESLPGRRRLRKREGTAKQEIGWSEATAASSVLAFWLFEVYLAFLAA